MERLSASPCQSQPPLDTFKPTMPPTVLVPPVEASSVPQQSLIQDTKLSPPPSVPTLDHGSPIATPRQTDSPDPSLIPSTATPSPSTATPSPRTPNSRRITPRQRSHSTDPYLASLALSVVDDDRRRGRASATQISILARTFEETLYPSTQVREELARRLNMTPRAVQIWFQNQRQKMVRRYDKANGYNSLPAPADDPEPSSTGATATAHRSTLQPPLQSASQLLSTLSGSMIRVEQLRRKEKKPITVYRSCTGASAFAQPTTTELPVQLPNPPPKSPMHVRDRYIHPYLPRKTLPRLAAQSTVYYHTPPPPPQQQQQQPEYTVYPHSMPAHPPPMLMASSPARHDVDIHVPTSAPGYGYMTAHPYPYVPDRKILSSPHHHHQHAAPLKLPLPRPTYPAQPPVYTAHPTTVLAQPHVLHYQVPTRSPYCPCTAEHCTAPPPPPMPHHQQPTHHYTYCPPTGDCCSGHYPPPPPQPQQQYNYRAQMPNTPPVDAPPLPPMRPTRNYVFYQESALDVKQYPY